MDNNNNNNQYYQPTQYQQNPQYQQPPQYQAPVVPYDPTASVMSVGSYVVTLLLSSIPVVNIICWIVWLVSPDTNKNKKNFIIANIIMYAITVVISIILVMIMAAAGLSLMGLEQYL